MSSIKFPKLAVEEIEYYLALLQENITSYDCSTLCKKSADDEPYCCTPEHAVPYLYKSEYELYSSRSDLWTVWKPTNTYEKKLKSTQEDENTVFCVCKGAKFCERENRSVSCRTFPLEPYLDKRGVFIGLVFMREFSEGCPLTKKPKDIRQEFIDSHFLFWEKLLSRRPIEYETYWKASVSYRKYRTKTKKKFVILFPSHLIGKNYIKKYI